MVLNFEPFSEKSIYFDLNLLASKDLWGIMAEREKLTTKFRRKIVKVLEERGVESCPMCKQRKFNLLDGFIRIHIQSAPAKAFVLGGPSVPVVAIICENCGFMSQHALGALDLLEELKKDRED